MKKKSLLIALIVLVFGTTACTKKERNSVDAIPIIGNNYEFELIGDVADAYFLAFLELYNYQSGITNGEYMAVDVTVIDEKYREKLIEYFERFSEENDVTLLLKTYFELVEEGYYKDYIVNGIVTDCVFEEGVFIRFNSYVGSEELLNVEVSMNQSGHSAVGMRFIVRKIDGKWEITDITDEWIA